MTSLWTMRLLRLLLLLALIGVLELSSRLGLVSATVLPAPSEIARKFVDLLPTAQFSGDLARTLGEIGLSSAIGIVLGLALGVACGRFRNLGSWLEPYLVSIYSMPTVVFYPLFLAAIGLGSGPIVIIAAVMVTVPVTLNTMVGVREINPALIKLKNSLGCSNLRGFRSIVLPAATPLLFPGIKLGIIYSVVGCVSMELIMSNHGLGYRIGFDYSNFDIMGMWANIIAVVVVSCVMVYALTLIESRIRADLA